MLSEYGITKVSGPVHINRVLREAGLIETRSELGRDMRALREVGFTGIASVELSRHSHAAPEAARIAIERLNAVSW